MKEKLQNIDPLFPCLQNVCTASNPPPSSCGYITIFEKC